MKAKLPVILIFGTLFFLVKCKHNPTDEIIPFIASGNANYYPVTPPKDTICFSSDILPLIISTCAKPGCHDAIYQKEGMNLTNYSNIKAFLQSKNPYTNNEGLYKVASGNTSKNMAISFPSSQNLIPADTASLRKLKKWIDQGAINSICNNCDTINVKYSTHIAPLIQQNCLGCHVSSNTILSNYTQVKTTVTSGKLYCAITQSTGCLPMPQGGSKLSDCKIRMVKIWIDAGAPNN